VSLRAPIVFTLFRTELRMLLRDRRVLLTSLVLPMLITPLLMLGSKTSIERREKALREMTYRYAVTGPEAASVRELVRITSARVDSKSKTNKARFQFAAERSDDATNALAKGSIHFILEGLGSGGYRATNGTNAAVAAEQPNIDEEEEETPAAGAWTVRVVFRGDRDDSGTGASQMREALWETRRLQRAALLKSRGLPVKPSELAVIDSKDLASKRQVAGVALGRGLTLILMLFILTGGAVVAIDSIAGEKERGTLETLLTTAASRVEILTAKHLGVLAIALLITLLQSANLLVYVGFKLLPLPENLAAAVTPGTVILLFFMYLPVAALVASVLLLISGYAKSYKEAQMYFMPALLLGLVPAIVPFLPGISLRSVVALLPVANVAVAVKDILTGSYDWPMIALAWLVTAGATVWITRAGARFLLTERLITASDRDVVEATGGLPLFERHVWRWFALLWGVLLIVSGYTEKLDIRLQLIVNLVILFFGAVLLMLRRYHLDPRAALSLRPPRPMVWLGVLFAAPGGFITALGVFQLANYFLPAPTSVIEAFGEGVLPKSIPFWQLLVFMTVLPGVFEELTFRGMLLHGLHRRLRPAALVLVVGVVFGIYHVALFRFVPTACLGMMFAAVTLLTGSIYPAMLWHALSNALGLLAYKLQVPETGLDPICYVAAGGMLAVAFWIFWRNRTPYPALKEQRREIARVASTVT
jgi:sodium transport system permease protein